MTDRESFLAAVAHTPDDDTPRLVFADWLDDTRDPADARLAEFVRLQVKLAHTPPRKVDYGVAVFLRPHGPRYWSHVVTLSEPPRLECPYAVGDRVDFDGLINRGGNPIKPKYGLLVTQIRDVDETSRLATVILHADSDSVPDPTAADRKRVLELWADGRHDWSRPAVEATGIKLPPHWDNVAVFTDTTAGYVHPSGHPQYPAISWTFARGFPDSYRVPAAADLAADNWHLARRLAAVPGVRRITPADYTPGTSFTRSNGTHVYSWQKEPFETAITHDVLPPDLFAVVAADPRRTDIPGVTGVYPNFAAFPDYGTALDALGWGVCNLARRKIGLPDAE